MGFQQNRSNTRVVDKYSVWQWTAVVIVFTLILLVLYNSRNGDNFRLTIFKLVLDGSTNAKSSNETEQHRTTPSNPPTSSPVISESELPSNAPTSSPTISPSESEQHPTTSAPNATKKSINEYWFEPNCSHYNQVQANNSDWCLDSEMKWRYRKNNPLRRTLLGAQQCLAQKHLLFIGDSRTRFQYLSLATFLTQGLFPVCKEGNIQNDRVAFCNLLKDGFAGWRKFYKETNQILSTADSNESCYCYRPERWNVALIDYMTENRFLTVQTRFGTIHITYLQSFVNKCMLDLSFPPFNEGVRSCEPGDCYFFPFSNEKNNNTRMHSEYRINVTETLWNVTRKFIPPVTHAFVTTGWKQLDIGCELRRWQNETGIPTWMISGPERKGLNWDIPNINPKQSCNVAVFDRTTMTIGVDKSTLYHDSVHVSSSINEEYNHVLFDLVCPEKAYVGERGLR